MKTIIRRPNTRGKRVIETFDDPSLADDSFREESDVNNIVAKHLKTGIPLPNNPGLYQDVSDIPDLLTAHKQVKEAAEAFNSLPALLREKLKNDPTNLVPYLLDPKNTDEAIGFGLLNKPPHVETPAPQEPQKTPKQKAKKNDELNDET